MTSKLQVAKPSDFEISLVREFTAPRPVVFDYFTKPELLQLWMTGPAGWKFEECRVDFRIGGDFRYVWTKPGSKPIGLSGTYQELIPHIKTVSHQIFDDDWTGGPTIETLEFSDAPNGTEMRFTIKYTSQKVRDSVLEYGMIEGMNQSYEHLQQLLT